MISGKILVFVVVLGVALAYAPGQYVPKLFYVIDEFGHQTEPVYIRNRRDIMDHPLFRVRRGGDSYASSSSHSSASSSGTGSSSSSSNSASGGVPYYGGDYIPSFESDPSDYAENFGNFYNAPSAGASGGAQSFASASSSSNSGNGGHGIGTGQSYGGLGSAQDVGYQGPILFSRFGEAEGTGVQVAGQAQGKKGAYSHSASSIDDKGKITYSVQSGKY